MGPLFEVSFSNSYIKHCSPVIVITVSFPVGTWEYQWGSVIIHSSLWGSHENLWDIPRQHLAYREKHNSSRGIPREEN